MKKNNCLYWLQYIICIVVSAYTLQAQSSNLMFISSIDKTTAPATDTLTISGRGFGSDIRVFFGGAVATPKSVTDGLIEVGIPPGATFDNITVVDVSRNLSASSSEFFTLSFSPDAESGGPGTSFEDRFETTATNLVRLSTDPFFDLCVCDFDGDGAMDVAGAAAAASTENTSALNIQNFKVFPNTPNTTGTVGGTPTFDESVKPTVGIRTNSPTLHITCGDLNNDGKADVVATQASAGGTTERSALFYAENTSTGTGNFSFSTPPEKFDIPTQDDGDHRNIKRVAIKDMDNDGRSDLIISNELDSLVFVYRNTGTGSNIEFDTNPVVVPGIDSEDSRLRGLSVKDLNNDGFPEIIVGSVTNAAIYVLENTSSPESISFKPTKELATNRGNGVIQNLTVGDLNGDGKNDIIFTANDLHRVVWLLNTTDSAPGSRITFESSFERLQLTGNLGPWGIDLGDLDGNDTLDILVGTSHGEGPYLLRNTTSASGVSFAQYSLNLRRSHNVRIADVNGDGKPDLLLANPNYGNDQTNVGIYVIENKHCMRPAITPEMGRACDAPFFIKTTPGPGVSYTWEAAGPTTVTRSSTDPEIDISSLLPAPSTPGAEESYMVTVTASIGSCAEESAQSAQIRKKDTGGGTPTIRGGDRNACEADAGTLMPDNVPPTASAHHWIGPGGATSTEQNWMLGSITSKHAGKYEYYYVNDGCPSEKASITLEVNNLPVVTIRSDAPYGCTGSAFSVELTSTSLLPPIMPKQWKRDGGPIPGETADSYPATQAGEYVLTYGDGTCEKDTPPLSVSEVAPPTAALSLPNNWCESVELMPSLKASAPQEAIDAGLTELAYTWDMGDGGTPPASEAMPTYTYNTPGTYTVSVKVSYEQFTSCSNISTSDLNVIETPTIALTRDPDKDEKCPTEEITITAPNKGQIPGGGTTTITSYLWSTGETSDSIKVRREGIYSVVAMDNAGCMINAETTIRNLEDSGIALLASGHLFENDTLSMGKLEEQTVAHVLVGQLKNETEGIIEWTREGIWKPSPYMPKYIQENWAKNFVNVLDTTQRHFPKVTAHYDEYAALSDECAASPDECEGVSFTFKVTAQDKADCVSEAWLAFDVSPNKTPEGFTMFSPNNDGRLDKWRIYKINLNPDACDVKVFDRRGTLVFEEKELPGNWQGWDGTYLGKGREPLAEDVYFYIVECDCNAGDCPRTGSGSLLLVR